jgi:hypothetical protein
MDAAASMFRRACVHLGWRWHHVCAPLEGQLEAALGVLSHVGKAELQASKITQQHNKQQQLCKHTVIDSSAVEVLSHVCKAELQASKNHKAA